MQCMALQHQFTTSSLLICKSSFGTLITPKTFSTARAKSKVRSSTCYPIQCSVVNSSNATTIDRRSANYEPPIWSFDYIQSLSSQYKGEPYTTRLNKLKIDVKRMLVEMESSLLLTQLELIDTLQRLGISYHFENEIKTLLKKKFITNTIVNNPTCDLYTTALEFRLLRQYGFAVTQEIFNVFKDERGEFKASDVMGVLALYEASFYEKKDENILEEARVFTTEYLKKYMIMMEQNKLLCKDDNNMVLLVRHALEIPLHWRTTKTEARWFIDVYERRKDMNNNNNNNNNNNSTLLEFAKLDFNMVQSIYQEDLKHLSRWWSHSKLGEKMDYARDRLVEAFLWQIGVRFEPEFSYFRRISARLYVLITVIDDIYDVYGTLEELELFTNAVERWDVKAIDELPDYMKMPFFTLFNTINEMAYDLLGEQNFVNVKFLKNTWAELCRCYLHEAKWFYSGYKPTLKEYIDNAWLSIGGPVIFVHAFFSFTNPITKEALQFLEDGYYPSIIRQGSTILRLADDLGTSSDELKRGDIPKSIQCYMHDTGVSEDEAREHSKFMISKIWKEMNSEDEYNSCYSKEFVQVCKNLSRMALFMYQHGDGHGSQTSQTKERIYDLIINPIPM
ncbi:(+)-alpha-pinene synthase, chloroplastic-like [Humulus lupulus]|uniref:(+)-alpha-pinene synthase, chloroplastic-like n=1 Tax=Humulus lupulus TaxID=3486 RepID=UPI002B40154B|nr:(+)-alpha-pinene synthase, chloroplastic-like [Humulus lupulus]